MIDIESGGDIGDVAAPLINEDCAVLPGVVTLKKAHTHRGVDYAVGDEIRLTERQVKWLKKQGKV